jgi:Tetratricopeptide repeat
MIKRRKIVQPPLDQPASPEPVPVVPSPEESPVLPAPQTKTVPWRWMLAGFAAIGLGAMLWYFLRARMNDNLVVREEGPPEDPRLTYVTPFRNVRPEVKYLGDQACVACHREESNAFHQHSMGRSVTPGAEKIPKQQYDASQNDPFQALGKEYRVERSSDQVVHWETYKDSEGKPVVETKVNVQYTIGSGTHACSYLFMRGDRVIQSPITWYSSKQRWDLSPGFLSVENSDNTFSRPVGTDCLFCHSNHVDSIEGSMNRYRMPLFPRGQAIGCERCHGPGGLHVSERSQNLEVANHIDHSIVNPRHLEPELREAVCQQCHLEGNQRIMRRGRQPFDYRPGMPLQLFYSTLVFVPEEKEEGSFTGHVEQMYASRCFIASQGKMGCITCHDPHEPLSRIKPDTYRQQCIACHQDKGCSLPVVERQKNQDNCVICHMPRQPSTDIQHTAITDHRILKKRETSRPKTPEPKQGQSPLMHFKTGQFKLDDAEAQRDMGIGLSELVKQPSPSNKQIAEMALSMLDNALKRWPNDSAALEAKAFLLYIKGQPQIALETIERVLAKSPQRESALSAAANYAIQVGQMDKAFTYSREAVNLNPYVSAWRFRLAQLFVEQKEYDQAATQCRETLMFNPGAVRVRMLLVSVLLQSGKGANAREEFDTVMKMNPPNKNELKSWFDRQRR